MSENNLILFLVPNYQLQPHITLYACGFELPSTQINILESLSLKAFDIMIGGTNSFDAAVFIEVNDYCGGITTIRHALNQHSPEDRDSLYIPHITIGLYNSNWPTHKFQNY